MTRRQALLCSCVPGLLYGQNGGWSLHFVRVNDRVEVRNGGPRGPVIAHCDRRGCADSPVGNGPSISLYARATSASGYGDCWVDVLYGGRRVASWQFKGEQFRQFQR